MKVPTEIDSNIAVISGPILYNEYPKTTANGFIVERINK